MYKDGENINHLLEGCRNDDRKSQELLYRSYYSSLMNICLRYTASETDAMAVLNMGFLKIFKNIRRYDPIQGSLYTWMRTVVVNTCLDHNKVQRREAPLHQLHDAIDVEIEPAVIEKMKAGAIIELVRRLPSATQVVFNLYIMEGYSHKEIAAALQVSEGTSKWHLSEARRLLKQFIEQQDKHS